MKVVERKPVPIYEDKCPECQSVIEYLASEVHLSHIICPVCGIHMWAETTKPKRYEEKGEP